MKRDDFFTPPEAAKEMMCSPMFVRSLIRERKLPVYQVGKRFYIPRSAIVEYIASQTVPVVTASTGSDENG